MRLLVTRPSGEAERTGEMLRARGHDVLFAPMLRIDALADADLGEAPWTAVMMTSGNAARALARHAERSRLLRLPLLAVGHQTAASARQAGFSDIMSADGDAAELARLAASGLGKDARVLYLAGSDRARDLGADLRAQGIIVDTVVVYRAEAARDLPDAVRRALQARELDGVLHYSRRTAAICLDCAAGAGFLPQFLALTHYCLSPRVAEPLTEAGAIAVRTAAHPDEDALLALLGGR